MTDFELDINEVGIADKYLVLREAQKPLTDDSLLFSVARVLDTEEAQVEAQKVLHRYNAYDDMVDVLQAIRNESEDDFICQAVDGLLHRIGEAHDE